MHIEIYLFNILFDKCHCIRQYVQYHPAPGSVAGRLVAGQDKGKCEGP